MKILGLIFSARKDGNTSKMLYYCMDKLDSTKNEVEMINIHYLNINPCGKCQYECCKNAICPINDDIPSLFNKCLESDLILFGLPTYCGHLPSTYFIFSERSQAMIKNEKIYVNEFLKKLNFIFIGNIIAGADMSSHEALYSFAGRDFFPETTLLSSRDYNMKPINGDLIENQFVRHKLDGFVERILQKY
ncbi:flavodoxin family protein [Bacillus sp. 03113]|uniref:flavodoxin family protein n=1 Tax=Bacillus sp. 03113 TaxID=2578211 RepID=UPI0011450ACF|nr:NAD(P)H-dependent oxidoreductase [Bacillus sp. 03113]